MLSTDRLNLGLVSNKQHGLFRFVSLDFIANQLLLASNEIARRRVPGNAW